MHISTLKKITLSILLVVALSPTNLFANAGASVGSCIGSAGLVGAVQGMISSIASGATTVPVTDGPLEGKETGILGTGVSWDQMGWCLANGAIEQIGNATVQWINSGFQGNPVFVTDPAGFFANLADVQAGAFFAELGGGGMCPSLQNVVRVNLANSYNSRYSQYGNQCTFSGVAGSLEQFTSGQSFSWQDWLSYTQVPQNNELGSTMFGQIELDKRIASVLGLEKNKLDWSGGFFSIEDEKGNIKTPGRVVEEQINEKLFSGQRRIEVADEFNEVVSALVSQLISTSIGEIMGTGSGNGYSSGYVDPYGGDISPDQIVFVTFDANGGSGTMQPQPFEISTPQALQPNQFVRSTYNFLGWNTNRSGNGTSYSNGAIFSADSEAINLYAQWTTETIYSLSVSKIGEGSVRSGQSPIRCGYNCTGTFEAGTEVTLTATPAQGYTFVGWQGGSCGDITEPTCTVTMSQSRNITATFTENTYTLDFDSNGGTGSMLIQIFTEGEAKPINRNTYTRTGYTFAGWSTTPTGTATYDDRDRYTMGSQSRTLYAVWEEQD